MTKNKPMTVKKIREIFKNLPDDMEVVVTDPRAFQNYDVCWDILDVRFDQFIPNVVGGRDSARPCIRIIPKDM